MFWQFISRNAFQLFYALQSITDFSGGARGNVGMNGGGDGKWQHHNGILLFIFFLNPTRKYKKREKRQKPEQNKNRERNL